MPTSTYTFNINQPSVALNQGDKLIFKFVLNGSSSNNFTASISQGNLTINSTSAATGYATTVCSYLSSASIAVSDNELIFNSAVSSFYDNNYIFVPNPLSGSINSLYSTYGDVDYPFIVNPYDIVLIYLSDGTYLESRVLKAYKDNNNLLRLTLDVTLSSFVKSDLVGPLFKRLLILSRVKDETNAYVVYSKRPGQTSYGFVIPPDLATDVLDNIDVITREVKQKLLADQQGLTQ
jgi:hypothetical protein